MSVFVRKSHNVSVLLYHAVCPTKYRRAMITQDVDAVLHDVCLEIADRYEIEFIEIGVERNHVHFLVQSVPTYSPSKIVQTIKSLTAREIKARLPQVKDQLWGSAFWSAGYFINTVGSHGTEDVIRRYVAQQGQDYQQLHVQQLALF